MSRMNEGQTGQAAASATDQLKDKATQVAGTVRETADHLKDAAREQYEHIRDSASEYYDQGREKAQEWQHTVEQYVQDQPVKALLIAAGVGVLLGVLWKKS